MEYYIIIGVMVVIGILPMGVEIYYKNFSFFNLKNPFIIYFLLQLGFSGIYSVYTKNNISYTIAPTSENMIFYVYTVSLSAIGLLLFQLGYYTKRFKFSFQERKKKSPLDWNNKKVNLFVFFSLITGYLALIIIITINGGYATFMDNRESWRGGGMQGQGYLIFPATQFLTISGIIFIIQNSEKYKNTSKMSLIIILVLTVIPAFILGFRSLIVLPIIQYSLIWNYTIKKISTTSIMIFAIVLMLVFTIYGVYRASRLIDGNINDIVQVISENDELAFSVLLRSRGVEVVSTTIKKLHKTKDYQLGFPSIFESLTIIIPHFIWENKPTPLSIKYTTTIFGDNFADNGDLRDSYGGVSPTIIGELFWHFGMAGVFIGMFLLGRVTKNIYCSFKKNVTRKRNILFYAYYFTTFIFFAESWQGYFNSLVMVSITIYIVDTIILQTNLTRKVYD